jgi:hypothetical protein
MINVDAQFMPSAAEFSFHYPFNYPLPPINYLSGFDDG